jgi:hypothetical protein
MKEKAMITEFKGKTTTEIVSVLKFLSSLEVLPGSRAPTVVIGEEKPDLVGTCQRVKRIRASLVKKRLTDESRQRLNDWLSQVLATLEELAGEEAAKTFLEEV